MAAKKIQRRKAPAQKTSRRTKKPAKTKRTRSAAPVVADFMTSSVHTIGRDQSLARAHELMNQHRIRHLPVLDGGELVGIVSQRDLYFVEALDGAAASEIRVEEAMTQDVFVTAQDTPLVEVASTMIKKKFGCAVVIRAGKVIGVFSTIDGLEALLKYVPA